MSSPSYCDACGHSLGIGRFCTNCGRPVPGRHPEAVPTSGAPAAPVVEPPTASDLPGAARYPLFADGGPDGLHAPAPAGPPAPLPGDLDLFSSPAPVGDGGPRRGGPGPVVWIAAAAVVALIVALGVVLLTRGSGGDSTADDPAAPTSGPTGGASDRASDGTDGGDGATRAPDDGPLPDARGTDSPVPAPDPESVGALSVVGGPEVPAVANPSRDTKNRPVTFDAANMTDADPRTAWRMPGDGTGSVITFDLGSEAVVTEVGLINGYAKVDGPNDWYPSNRRIREVQWEFDDGTRITQRLERDRDLQTLRIDPVRTTGVRLRILEVSGPGKRNGRDFTAISAISFMGATSSDADEPRESDDD